MPMTIANWVSTPVTGFNKKWKTEDEGRAYGSLNCSGRNFSNVDRTDAYSDTSRDAGQKSTSDVIEVVQMYGKLRDSNASLLKPRTS